MYTRSRQEFDQMCEWLKKNHRIKRNELHNKIRGEQHQRNRIKKRKEKATTEDEGDIIEIATNGILSQYKFATV